MSAGTTLSNLFSIDTASVITDVAAGNAVTSCPPSGGTCTDLPGTSAGILMRTVDDGVGHTYIQTIIADTSGGQSFANEQIAQQGIQGTELATNIAQKMIIDDPTEGFHADHTMVGDGYVALVPPTPNGTGNEPWYVLNQTISSAGGSGSAVTAKVRIQGTINDGGGNVGDNGNNRKVYIDQVSADPEFGEFRYRWANVTNASAGQDLYTGNTSTSTPAAVGTTLVAGDNVAALFVHQAVDTGNPTLDDFGFLKFFGGVTTADNLTTSASTDLIVFQMDLVAPGGAGSTGADPGSDGWGIFASGTPALDIFGPISGAPAIADFDNSSFLP